MKQIVNSSVSQSYKLHACGTKHTIYEYGEAVQNMWKKIHVTWERNVKKWQFSKLLGLLKWGTLVKTYNLPCKWVCLDTTCQNTEALLYKMETKWIQCCSLVHINNTLVGFLGFLNRMHLWKRTLNFVNKSYGLILTRTYLNIETLIIKIRTEMVSKFPMLHVSNTLAAFLGFLGFLGLITLGNCMVLWQKILFDTKSLFDLV